jgi:hypothetical protein
MVNYDITVVVDAHIDRALAIMTIPASIVGIHIPLIPQAAVGSGHYRHL